MWVDAVQGRPNVTLFLPSFQLNTLGSLKSLTFEIHRPLYFRHFWANAIAQLLWRVENTQIDTIKIHMVDVPSSAWDMSGVTRHDPIEETQTWVLLDAALVQPKLATLRSVDIEFFFRREDEISLSNGQQSDLCNLPKMPLLSALLGERLCISNHYK
ncbi:hypothetical protein HYPSUDRAFT_316237 [Hypholoma sublateritium FD-334 SS-4]|uniref:Uncharacterized protein n=1 Tax=Hypholoma sublateritium (strain FD-334 SS-4) TaxID=945553 RepID=A0A0D2MQR0_HYPSF|nr:hypothetical protein HYPSUDRAFT_316237 [Hypholoma sublateritium FD-334 SS-4]